MKKTTSNVSFNGIEITAVQIDFSTYITENGSITMRNKLYEAHKKIGLENLTVSENLVCSEQLVITN